MKFTYILTAKVFKLLPGERSVTFKSANETEAGEKYGKLGDVWTCKVKKATLWPEGAGESRLSIWRSCNMLSGKKRSLISMIKLALNRCTYFVIAIWTVFSLLSPRAPISLVASWIGLKMLSQLTMGCKVGFQVSQRGYNLDWSSTALSGLLATLCFTAVVEGPKWSPKDTRRSWAVNGEVLLRTRLVDH